MLDAAMYRKDVPHRTRLYLNAAMKTAPVAELWHSQHVGYGAYVIFYVADKARHVWCIHTFAADCVR